MAQPRQFGWFWIWVLSLLACGGGGDLFGGEAVIYDARDLRVQRSVDPGFFRDKHKIQVVAKGQTLQTITQSKYFPVPTLDHVKNYFELVLGEATKTEVPVAIDTGNYDFTYSLEYRFGLHVSNYLQSFLLISPHRIKVHQEKKTKAVTVLIDGKEIFSRDKKSSKSTSQKIEDSTLDYLMNRITNTLVQAESDGKLVEVNLASYVIGEGVLVSPLTLSEVSIASVYAQERRRFEKLDRQRKELVWELKNLDSELDSLEEQPDSLERLQKVNIRREDLVKQLKILDSQLKSLQDQMDSQKAHTNNESSSPRHHSYRNEI